MHAWCSAGTKWIDQSWEHIYEELTALQKAMATSFRNLCLGNLNIISAKCIFMELIYLSVWLFIFSTRSPLLSNNTMVLLPAEWSILLTYSFKQKEDFPLVRVTRDLENKLLFTQWFASWSPLAPATGRHNFHILTVNTCASLGHFNF